MYCKRCGLRFENSDRCTHCGAKTTRHQYVYDPEQPGVYTDQLNPNATHHDEDISKYVNRYLNTKIYCKKCGRMVTDAGHCSHCGTRNTRRHYIYEAQMPGVYFNPTNPKEILYDDRVSKYVNKYFYVILALLIGQLGIHKFYAGKNNIGVIYIILGLLGLSFILCIIDVFRALMRDDDGGGTIAVFKNEFFV